MTKDEERACYERVAKVCDNFAVSDRYHIIALDIAAAIKALPLTSKEVEQEPVAWIATHEHGKILHLSKLDGWVVLPVLENYDHIAKPNVAAEQDQPPHMERAGVELPAPAAAPNSIVIPSSSTLTGMIDAQDYKITQLRLELAAERKEHDDLKRSILDGSHPNLVLERKAREETELRVQELNLLVQVGDGRAKVKLEAAESALRAVKEELEKSAQSNTFREQAG